MAWLPNEFLVKPSRPQIGTILGARISPSWAAEAHGTYFTSPGTQPAQPTLGIVHLEGSLTWFLLGDRAFTPYLTGGAGCTGLVVRHTGSAASQHVIGRAYHGGCTNSLNNAGALTAADTVADTVF